ncbi:MAG: 5'-methylthioadenosine/adenosylhomocysteine nucleosidase [Eubacterium sp.]|nr:5'-methylthioadenosine/adenosylhomocysteine nucleosidase [Eubacterium sp.]
MKTILIIAAMEEEIRPLIDDGDFRKREESPFSWYEGERDGRRWIVTVSRVGKVAMGACVQHFITMLRHASEFAGDEIELVINMGVAGAIDRSLNQGDIVIGDKLCQHDMDVAGLGYEPGLNPDYDSVYFVTPTKLVEAAKRAYESMDTEYSLVVGTIASGDQFVSSHEKKEYIESTFKAYACEMEGAALAQVCSDNDVPFLVIRAISDKADGEAPLSYADFKAAAIVNLTGIVIGTIEQM